MDNVFLVSKTVQCWNSISWGPIWRGHEEFIFQHNIVWRRLEREISRTDRWTYFASRQTCCCQGTCFIWHFSIENYCSCMNIVYNVLLELTFSTTQWWFSLLVSFFHRLQNDTSQSVQRYSSYFMQWGVCNFQCLL